MTRRRKHTAKTPIELLAKVYKAEGWKRQVGESRTKRVGQLYTISADHKRGVYVAEPAMTTIAREPDDDERPDEPSPDEFRRMRALYDAEKAAGLLKPREEYEADLIDAGRGHLIRRD